jgi:putative transposase
LRGRTASAAAQTGRDLKVVEWITAIGAKTAYIERGSPWENGYVESFNARLCAISSAHRDP